MDNELLIILQNWKNSDENYFNSQRNVKSRKSKYAIGEFEIIIQSVLIVNKETVSLGRRFHTYAQSDVSYIKNKRGDINRLNAFIKKFDEDFNNEVEKKLLGPLNDLDDNGFLNL